MTLQEQMKKKIDDFGGISFLTLQMEKLRSQTKEKNWYNNMIIYFNSLYTQEIDVVSHTLDYHQATVDTVDFLKSFNKNLNDKTNEFLIELIRFKLQSVAKIRKIS